jgi:hypothetical protein
MRQFVRNLSILAIIATGAVVISCQKDAGEGGTSAIMGKVLIYRYDPSLMSIVDTIVGSEEDVYIIYGADHSTYDDDFKCSFDGSYEFWQLRKGDYRLFAYSDDTTGLSEQLIDPNRPKMPVFVRASISSNKSEVTAPDIIIFDKR